MELNDFPENIVKKTIKNHLKKQDKLRKENDDVQQQIPLYLLYEKGISEKISRLAKKYNVKVVNQKGKSLENILKTKDNKQDANKDTQGAAYKVNCLDCEQCYIGETGRTIKIRLKEHKQDVVRGKENISGLSKHIRDTNHNIDWDNIYILNKKNDFQKRKFKEAVAIRKMTKKTMNKKEKVKTISSIWENLI